MAGDSPVSEPGACGNAAMQAPDARATGPGPARSLLRLWSTRLVRSRLLRFGGPAIVSVLAVGIAALEIAAATTDAPRDDAVEEHVPVEQYHRIAAGPAGAPTFSLGRRIANAISRPVGAPGCTPLEGCGVEGLIAVATSLTPAMPTGARLEGAGSARSGFPGIAGPSSGRQVEAILLPLADATDAVGMRLVGVVGTRSIGNAGIYAWLVVADLPEDTVFGMAASVWRLRSTTDLSFSASPAAAGARLPDLHPGAAAFYREMAAASRKAD